MIRPEYKCGFGFKDRVQRHMVGGALEGETPFQSAFILQVEIQVTNKALSVFSSHPLLPGLCPKERKKGSFKSSHPKSSYP